MKTLLTICLIVLTTAASAQSIEEFVADFERQKAMSLAYIDAMPADKFDFKPTQDTRSFAEQMLHFSQGTFNIAANGTGGERMYADKNLEKEPSLQNKEEVARIVAESFDYVIKELEGMDSSSFDEIVERGPFKVTRRGWLNKALEHVAHHKGQCAIYLRLARVTPPKYRLF